MQVVYISGHRNPDTDTIGAAIGFAELKSHLDHTTDYAPVRLGDPNPQTLWVLKQAGARPPMLLEHIHPRACDVMSTEFARVNVADTLRSAGTAMLKAGDDLIPVLQDNGALAGVITIRTLASRYVQAPSAGSDAACGEVVEDAEVLASTDDLATDVASRLQASSSNTALVVDGQHRLVGLLGAKQLETPVHRRVILVDHAERTQSIPGIEDAEIIEIIDHHHLGSIETKTPIRATFDPIGSTATLVTERFRENAVTPSSPAATMLLGAVLSDTVVLNSPTTTKRDVAVAEYLGEVLGLDPREFGRRMFKETSDVSGISAADLVTRDAKGYESSHGTRFMIAQIEVVGKDILERARELLDAIHTERSKQGVSLYALMVTDILEQNTELLVDGDLTAVSRAFGVTPQDGDRLILPGVMSRKKQVAPRLLEAL